MEIEIIGKVRAVDVEEKIFEKLEEVLVSTVDRLEADQNISVNDAVVVGAKFTVGLEIEGMDEPQFLTVEHHEGVPEMFKWVIDYNAGTELNNENGSAYDAWSIAKTKGNELPFETVESAYDDNMLVVQDKETFGDMSRVTYSHKEEDHKVIRIYQNDRLVQELKLVPKENSEETTEVQPKDGSETV